MDDFKTYIERITGRQNNAVGWKKKKKSCKLSFNRNQTKKIWIRNGRIENLNYEVNVSLSHNLLSKCAKFRFEKKQRSPFLSI